MSVPKTGEAIDADNKTQIAQRREWLSDRYGDKCEEFDSDCVCCRLWANQEEFERLVLDWPLLDEMESEETE